MDKHGGKVKEWEIGHRVRNEEALGEKVINTGIIRVGACTGSIFGHSYLILLKVKFN